MIDLSQRYVLAVGSNRGDRRAHFAAAAQRLEATGQIRITARSAVVEGPAVGGPTGQGPYLNAVWLLESSLGPHQLLDVILAVETAGGRTRTVPWGPRTIDLDLILRSDGLRVATPVLSLPHPRWRERRFVADPIRELAQDHAWLRAWHADSGDSRRR